MQDEDIRKAREGLKKLAADKDAERQREIWESAERDYRSGMESAWLDGYEEGLELGRQEGRRLREEARQKGYQEGIG